MKSWKFAILSLFLLLAFTIQVGAEQAIEGTWLGTLDISGIKKTIFPHPTLSETFHEAALASDNEAIHMLLDSVQYGLEE